MKDRLINRIGRIISGSFNSLVDAIENAAPETVMAIAVRNRSSCLGASSLGGEGGTGGHSYLKPTDRDRSVDPRFLLETDRRTCNAQCASALSIPNLMYQRFKKT